MSENGFARIGRVLTHEQCQALRESYADPKLFRSRIEMSRFGFGRGEYKYFAAPLPDLVARLREQFYVSLRAIANEWMAMLGNDIQFPSSLINFLARGEAHGQKRPTPLLLRYQAGDYNCLHQDLYGAIFFPFQVIICLSAAGEDFTGGELLLVEQRPRAQSVGRVINLAIAAMHSLHIPMLTGLPCLTVQRISHTTKPHAIRSIGIPNGHVALEDFQHMPRCDNSVAMASQL